MSFLDDLSLPMVIVFCLTLGLSPFSPPHVVEKLNMLFSGSLTAPMDIFDLLLHGAPWVLLMLKLARHVFTARAGE